MAIDLSRSRRTLPAPMLDRSSYSIFSVIKHAIGKDLTRFSIPVMWNEPLSFLQRLAENFEYSSLLDRAALADSSVERFHLITAFLVTNMSTNIERMSKPFNPLLGETYELNIEGDSPLHYVAEQVSHHPPVSAFHARGQYWHLTAHCEPKIKFHGTNVEAVPEGRWVLRFAKKVSLSRSTSQSSFHSCPDEELTEQNGVAGEENDDDEEEEEYTWKSPSILVHNVLFGRLWCEFHGQLELNHTQSNRRALLTIKSHSWFASQATKTADMFKYSGFIYDGKEKLSAFHGNYGHCYYAIDDLNDVQLKSSSSCSAGGENCIHLSTGALIPLPCDLILTPSSRLIWHRSFTSLTNEEQASRSRFFFFTPFAMALNEQLSSTIKLPSTDCRFRQDIRYVESGDLDAASIEKHRLEEKQRAEAKERIDVYKPFWFTNKNDDEFVYTGKYEQRDFAHCPELFSDSYLSSRRASAQ